MQKTPSDKTQQYPPTGVILDSVNTIDDLRRLPVSDLEQLSFELRHYIIQTLSRHPGHLASSLGTVELTLALHYVFNTPDDKLVWDVGHQAYAHKKRSWKIHTISRQRMTMVLSTVAT